MSETGKLYGRLTRETLESLIADSQSTEIRKWLLKLLNGVPSSLGYSISDPMCILGVKYEHRAYSGRHCPSCDYYKADKFPPGTGECRWSDWQKLFRLSTPTTNDLDLSDINLDPHGSSDDVGPADLGDFGRVRDSASKVRNNK